MMFVFEIKMKIGKHCGMFSYLLNTRKLLIGT